MLGGLSSSTPLVYYGSRVVAVLLTALAVRILDDAFDETPKVSAGTVAYVAVLVALGATVETTTAMTLFLACYALGMTTDLGRPLPSGFTALGEGALVLLLGAWRFGGPAMLGALAVITFIQAADDVIDYPRDLEMGVASWATRWGRVETMLLGSAAFTLAMRLDPVVAVSAPIAAWAVSVGRDALVNGGEG